MLLCISLTLVLATPPTPAEQAQQAIGPFKKTLQQTLLKALDRSPEAAVEVCANAAPALAAQASTPAVAVGRSALKLRSPRNAPEAWLKKAMVELSREKPGTATHRLVTLSDGSVGYAEPIWLAPQCLVCHGKKVSPQVASALATSYPNDAATGFDEGEFRGVFWAVIKSRPATTTTP